MPPKEKFTWAPARREEIRAKVTLEGPSGSGKTVGALSLACGLAGGKWERVCVVDAENHRALYAHGQSFGGAVVGDFRHLPLPPPYSPERFVDALRQVEESGEFDAVVVDGASKEWEGQGGTLERVGAAGEGKNQFAAWKVPGDRHRQFIDAIVASTLHVVVTFRSKVKYEIVEVQRDDGRLVKEPRKIGMEPVQRAGTEYEFDVAFRMDSLLATISKDNTRLFMADPPQQLGQEHGRRILEWSRGASCQLGGAEWVALRLRQVEGYGGSLEGLRALWQPIALARRSVPEADFARLERAKDAAKARLGGGAG